MDIFQNDQTAALADASTRIAPDLTAGFGDTFDAALTSGIEWHNSLASQFAKEHAMADYIGYVRDKTGETLPNPAYLIGGGTLEAFNERQAKIAEAHPDLGLSPLSPADVESMTAMRMAKAHAAGKAMDKRERTWGGTAGGVLGAGTAMFTDPIILATLPLGGMGELGIIGRGLEFAAINAGTEAAIDLAQLAQRERAVPGSWKEIPGDVATAGAFGFALGGAFGGLAKWLKAGEKPLPTSLRDEVNVGTSDAQIATTNIFPTAEGEMAGRDALSKSVTQAAEGQPITAGDAFDPSHARAFGDAVGARTPDEIASAANQSQRPITYDVIAEHEPFDRMPAVGENAAAYWDDIVGRATPLERDILGDVPDEVAAARAMPTRNIGPAEIAKIAEEPATLDAVQKALIDYRVANPDAEFSTHMRMPDGTYQITTRRLADVMGDLDQQDHLARELMTCATGAVAA